MEIVHCAASVPQGRAPLLFVHGVCHGACCWDCHAIGLRGHRNSGGREGLHKLGLYDYAEYVRSAARRYWSANEMGGGITQLLLIEHPSEWAGAVLLASMPPGWLTWRESARMMMSVRGLLAVRKLLQGGAVTTQEVQSMAFLRGRASDQDAARWAKLLQPES